MSDIISFPVVVAKPDRFRQLLSPAGTARRRPAGKAIAGPGHCSINIVLLFPIYLSLTRDSVKALANGGSVPDVNIMAHYNESEGECRRTVSGILLSGPANSDARSGG